MDVVLADDLSGAAEIAGIAWRRGRRVGLYTGMPGEDADIDVAVVDTDTRLLSAEAAAQRVGAICRQVRGWQARRVFKKVDSVLRGPVVAEIEAALDGLGRDRAVLVAANPSRGRVIRGGRYFIDGQPLDETEFASDPLHPACSNDVEEILDGGLGTRLRWPDATSMADVETAANALRADELPVGAADFFRSCFGGDEEAQSVNLPGGRRLWVCGSQTIRGQRLEGFARQGIAVAGNQPGEPCLRSASQWSRAAQSRFDEEACRQVAMEFVDGTLGSVEALLCLIAEAAGEVIREVSPAVIFVEGGATARSLIEVVGWECFEVFGELAAGVVVLRPVVESEVSPPLIVVKPGSYPWPPHAYLDAGD